MRVLLSVFVILASAHAALANTGTSMRPVPRPSLAVSLVPEGPSDLAVPASVRPTMRMAASVILPVAAEADPVTEAGFRAWIAAFSTRARTEGISQRTLERAFEGVRLNARVIERDRNQSEFSRTLWDYLDSAASPARI